MSTSKKQIHAILPQIPPTGDKLFRVLLEKSKDAVALLSRDRTLLYISPAIEQLLGYTPDEYAYLDNRADLLHPDEKERCVTGFLAVFHTPGETRVMHHRMRHKDGTYQWIELTCTNFFEDPDIAALLVSFRDITASKEVEFALQASESHYRVLMQEASDAIFVTDRDGHIADANEKACELLGFSHEELLTHSLLTLVHPDDLYALPPLIQTLHKHETVQAERRLRRKDGTYILIEGTGKMLSDGRVLNILRDMTERQHIEEERKELVAREQKAHAEVEAQRSRFFSMLMQAPAIINMFTGPEHVFAFVNANFIELLGDRQFLGKTVREAQPELEGQGIYELLDRVYQTGEPFFGQEIGVHIETPNGPTKRYYNFIYQPTRDGNGHIDGIVSFAFEVTAQVVARQEIEEREEHFRFLANAMPQQVWTATPDGALDYVNERVVTYFGQSEDAIRGTGWQSLLHPDDLAHCLQAWNHSLQTGDPYQIEFRLRAHDGTYKWHLGRALPLRNNGTIVRWFGTNTDIDEYKKLQAQKDEFIAMASHELKTPLTSLKGFTNILQRRLSRQSDEQALSYLVRIDRQADKLTNLISDLLDISKMQAGKLTYRKERFDVGALVQEIVETLQATTGTYQLCLESSVPALMFGDRDRLGQVLINLVTNAIKYSPQANKVLVRVFTDENTVMVSVQDFGVGIAKEYQQKIFERFYQVNDEEQHPFSGLGVGLYLSGEIIKRHLGRIWVESQKGEGATFSFALPLMRR